MGEVMVENMEGAAVVHQTLEQLVENGMKI